MPGYDDRLHARETSWKSGEDCGCGIVAMHYVGRGTSESCVQGAHQMKKRVMLVKNNLKAFSPQLFAKHTKPIKAVN
jgi:hypothetical protein